MAYSNLRRELIVSCLYKCNFFAERTYIEMLKMVQWITSMAPTCINVKVYFTTLKKCYINIAARGLTDTYARLLRAHSAQGRVRIYQSNSEQAVL